MRRILALMCLLVFVGHTLHFWRLPGMGRLDAVLYDARLKSHVFTKAQDIPAIVYPEVVIIDIDEASLAAQGRWPWDRKKMAKLVNSLTQEQQVAVLGFDMVFAEDVGAQEDEVLASALHDPAVVLGYYFTSDREGHTRGQLPAPVLAQQGKNSFVATSWNGYGANLATFVNSAPLSGFFNAITDRDGVVRSLPLLAEFKGQYYESLALAMVRRYMQAQAKVPASLPDVQSVFVEKGWQPESYRHLAGINLNGVHFSVDGRVAMLVPYRSLGEIKRNQKLFVSANDLLMGKVPPKALRNRVVLLGSSAPALQDFRATPVSNTYPGVEIQANMLAGLLDTLHGKPSAQQPDYAQGFEVVQLVVVGLLLLVVLPLVPAVWAVGFMAGMLLAIWLLHNALYDYAHLVLPQASTFALVLSAYLAHIGYGYFVEEHRRKQLTQLFGSYVSPHWVKQMVKSKQRYSMQASNQELTVMFCDMRGFTSLSEGLAPQALQQLLNDVFSRLTAVISAHDGTVDKYMGDCVMAFWGAPQPVPDHAARAMQCALAMQAAMDDYNQKRAASSPLVRMGIGVHTGVMCVGDMGSLQRRSYTVVGDAVNLAARLESLCKIYQAAILTSHATVEACQKQGTQFNWRDLGEAQIIGREQPVHLYTLEL